MSVEDDGVSRDVDYGYNVSVTTDAAGVWQREAHGRGYCEYTRPALLSNPGASQNHTAGPYAPIWLGTTMSNEDTSPLNTYTILPDG